MSIKKWVMIKDCYQCPNNISSFTGRTHRCMITKKKISGINCTDFPKTCPLQNVEGYEVNLIPGEL